MVIRQHELDAQVETAMQAKLRHGYTSQAVVVKSWSDEAWPHLGFFFADGYSIGQIGQHADRTHFQVLSLI